MEGKIVKEVDVGPLRNRFHRGDADPDAASVPVPGVRYGEPRLAGPQDFRHVRADEEGVAGVACAEGICE